MMCAAETWEMAMTSREIRMLPVALLLLALIMLTGGHLRGENIVGHIAEAGRLDQVRSGTGGPLAAYMPGLDNRGPGWNNLYLRDGNSGRLASVAHPNVIAGTGGAPNQIFSGSEGNIYRRTNNGWEEQQRGSWAPMNGVPGAAREMSPVRPGPAFGGRGAGLDRDFLARQRGIGRTNSIRSYGGSRGGGGGGRRR
jgi:hypothetical protein